MLAAGAAGVLDRLAPKKKSDRSPSSHHLVSECARTAADLFVSCSDRNPLGEGLGKGYRGVPNTSDIGLHVVKTADPSAFETVGLLNIGVEGKRFVGLPKYTVRFKSRMQHFNFRDRLRSSAVVSSASL